MYKFEHILYSHSDYDGIWDIWKHQLDRYLPNSKVHLFVNRFSLQQTYNYNIIEYGDSFQFYTDRVYHCLNQLEKDDQVVLYQHEDMFLYAQPDIETLNQFATLVATDEVDLIRLIRVVDPLNQSSKHTHLYKNPINDKFSTQPTLIKVRTLKQIFLQGLGQNIWEFEMNCSSTCTNLKSYFCYAGENKRGITHYDSNIYPYIATAICKGRWNMEEYPNELTSIFNETNQNRRGDF